MPGRQERRMWLTGWNAADKLSKIHVEPKIEQLLGPF